LEVPLPRNGFGEAPRKQEAGRTFIGGSGAYKPAKPPPENATSGLLGAKEHYSASLLSRGGSWAIPA